MCSSGLFGIVDESQLIGKSRRYETALAHPGAEGAQVRAVLEGALLVACCAFQEGCSAGAVQGGARCPPPIFCQGGGGRRGGYQVAVGAEDVEEVLGGALRGRLTAGGLTGEPGERVPGGDLSSRQDLDAGGGAEGEQQGDGRDAEDCCASVTPTGS